MLSNKPYLIRAFYEWIVDSKCTPFITVNTAFSRCKVPKEYIENNQITLNLEPEAIRDLKMGNEFIEFRASFSGVVHIISFPVKAVLGIYAEENEEGMYFDFEEDTEELAGSNEPVSQPDSAQKKRPPHLEVVK